MRQRPIPPGLVRALALLAAAALLGSAAAAPPTASAVRAAAPPAPGPGGAPSAGAAGTAAPGACVPVPFAQQVDVAAVAGLAREAPERLLARIEGMGIDVRRVPAAGAGRQVNPLLARLPVADARLLEAAGFQDGYEGRAMPRAMPPGVPERDTVLIRETASTWTLLHEVVHLMIVPTDGFVPSADLELRFSLAFNRLTVYQRRLYDDPWRLLDPRWRADIVDAQREVATLLFDRLRIGQSQEAIVERVLAGCVDERSPYHDAARREQGLRYGTAMIDNAIDVFNAVNASVEHTDTRVRHLRDEVAAGRVPPAPDRRLTAADREAFVDAQRVVRQALDRTRAEIETLKRHPSR